MSTKQEDTTRDGPVSSRFSWAFDGDVDTTPSSHVRQLLRNLLGDRHDTVVDDAVLVADELVTNALRHATAPRRCRVGLTNHGQRLRIEVDDATPERHPCLRVPDRSGGRGLVLLKKLALTWGVEYHPGHKTVWAELAMNRPGSDGNARHLTVVPADAD